MVFISSEVIFPFAVMTRTLKQSAVVLSRKKTEPFEAGHFRLGHGALGVLRGVRSS